MLDNVNKTVPSGRGVKFKYHTSHTYRIYRTAKETFAKCKSNYGLFALKPTNGFPLRKKKKKSKKKLLVNCLPGI